MPLKIQRHPNLNDLNDLPWNPQTEAHLIRGLRSQEVSCKGLQLMVGHILKGSQTTSCHGLFQVDCGMTEWVYCRRNGLIASVQYLHGCDPHRTAVQRTWKAAGPHLGHNPINCCLGTEREGRSSLCRNVSSVLTHKHSLGLPLYTHSPCRVHNYSSPLRLRTPSQENQVKATLFPLFPWTVFLTSLSLPYHLQTPMSSPFL